MRTKIGRPSGARPHAGAADRCVILVAVDLRGVLLFADEYVVTDGEIVREVDDLRFVFREVVDGAAGLVVDAEPRPRAVLAFVFVCVDDSAEQLLAGFEFDCFYVLFAVVRGTFREALGN